MMFYSKKEEMSLKTFFCAGMTGDNTSVSIVPYLDASVYMIILNSFLSVETGLGLFVRFLHPMLNGDIPKFFSIV